MRVSAALENITGQEHIVTVVNMSEDGLMFEYQDQTIIPPFSLFTLQVPGFFKCECYSVWQRGRQVGCQLTLPIHPAVIASISRSYPAPRMPIAGH